MAAALSCGAMRAVAQAPAFALKDGDRIALIGNGLADRQQHFGWLESLIYKANPEKSLVFRNLAFAGDEVATRHRSDNFGSPEDWLNRTQADVAQSNGVVHVVDTVLMPK